MSHNLETTDDPFDADAAPIMYMSDNRTPAVTDIALVIFCIIFFTCFLLITILVPSIRRNKWRNFVCLSLMIMIGVSIPISIMKNTWMVGERELNFVPYDSLYKNQFTGLIRVEIGLESMNISLDGQVTSSEYLYKDTENINSQQEKQVHMVDYNERFYFDKPEQMQQEHREALSRGLPYPILTVSEYFSQDSDGFNWARQVRQTGHYTSMLLYVTFASWLVTVVLMCAVPAYFMIMLRVTCLLSAASYLNYLICAWLLSPLIINIYSYELLIGPNYMITASAICSILAYYCAQCIDTMFDFQDNGQSPMTIMDSEGYLKDKQFFANMMASINSKAKITHRDSVIIPIEDIAELEKNRTDKRTLKEP